MKIRLWVRLARLMPAFWWAVTRLLSRPLSVAAQRNYDRVVSLVEATHRDLGHRYDPDRVLPQHRQRA